MRATELKIIRERERDGERGRGTNKVCVLDACDKIVGEREREREQESGRGGGRVLCIKEY